MFKIILLPGNGAHNRDWIERIQKEIGGTIQYYDHWISGEPTIDLTVEVEKLVRSAQGQPIAVFAKSAGCLVLLKAAKEQGVLISNAVFVGIPIPWGEELGLPVRTWLKEWERPTLFIHKEQDPVIPAQDLKALISERHQMLVLPGDDHDYEELEKYVPQVRKQLSER